MNPSSTIIGLSVYHADASAAALQNGQFICGVDEERFNRIKHWAGFPAAAMEYCTTQTAGSIHEVDAIAIAGKPKANFWRKISLAASHPSMWAHALDRRRQKKHVQSVPQRIAGVFGVGAEQLPQVHRVEHHMAHIASAYFCCPWDQAMCLTVDGFGDFTSAMRAVARGNQIQVLDAVHYPHSLGLFYTAVTQYIGFPYYGDEYKMMGLAAYGEPRFADKLRQLVHGLDGGLFELDQKYFRMLRGGVDMSWNDGLPTIGTVFTDALPKLLGQPVRQSDEPLTQFHKDLAASAQQVYEERFFDMVRTLTKKTGMKRLALAGGCALNSLANGKLFEQTDIEDVFIQASAGDGGTSLGAALYVQHAVLNRADRYVMEHAYFGPQYSDEDIRVALAGGIDRCEGGDGTFGELTVSTMDAAALCESTAQAIADGNVVGWYQGRSEWGPRALGNRSIVCDPRRDDMQQLLNLKVKRRESFRPFAPSILAERTGEWFTCDYPDPFMLKVYPIRPEKRPLIPAVTHFDGTGRLQTVSPKTNARYHQLISAFERITGVPIVLNTSFNENEPVVNTPTEALNCFLRTKMDRLVMGNVVVQRQPATVA